MNWRTSTRADPRAVAIADRHYNRQKPGTPQFVPPGSCFVLVIPEAAVWVTSWPIAKYVKHRWPGAWVNSCFRNERRDLYLSSSLIREALAASRAFYGEPPPLGLVTFIDRDKTKPKRDPGRCYLRAGGEYDGETAGGLVAIRFRPEVFPPAEPAMEGRMTYQCAPSCGFTYDNEPDYRKHLAVCPRVLPGVAATAKTMAPSPARAIVTPKKKRTPQPTLPFEA